MRISPFMSGALPGAGTLGLPAVADALYRSARRLRVFVARPVVGRDLGDLLGMLCRPAGEVGADGGMA